MPYLSCDTNKTFYAAKLQMMLGKRKENDAYY